VGSKGVVKGKSWVNEGGGDGDDDDDEIEEREWLLLLIVCKVVNGEGGEGCLIGAAFISVNCDGDANTLLSLTPENQRFSLNLGRPLFLCLMSMHVLDLSRETHRLQGLDTISILKKC
jgi:hypothetical protein